MKRLTEQGFDFTSDFIKRNIDSWSIAQCLKKLQYYEDLEEQKKLVMLPCGMDTLVYRVYADDCGLAKMPIGKLMRLSSKIVLHQII